MSIAPAAPPPTRQLTFEEIFIVKKACWSSRTFYIHKRKGELVRDGILMEERMDQLILSEWRDLTKEQRDALFEEMRLNKIRAMELYPYLDKNTSLARQLIGTHDD